MIFAVLAAVLLVGVLAGVCIAALFADSHVRAESEHAFALGQVAGERRVERLLPFAERDDDPRAAT